MARDTSAMKPNPARIAERHLEVPGQKQAGRDHKSAERAVRVVSRFANGWMQSQAASSVERYGANLREVRTLLKSIDKLVKFHEREQKANPRDWGWTGDMYHVKELLTEVERFLSPSNR